MLDHDNGGTELRRMGSGVAGARDIVVASMHRGPLGQLSVSSKEGDVVGRAISERTGAQAMRSRAVASMGGGSTGAVSVGTMEFIGHVDISRTNGENT
jgi:hypothetical protein